MKTILNTLKQKWAEYILEILVIIIGILGTFMLKSWHESRKLEIQRQELIASLIEDFEYNSRAHCHNQARVYLAFFQLNSQFRNFIL